MIAIFDRKGSFSDRWLALCREHGIPHVAVNILTDDLITMLISSKVTALLMHPPMADHASGLVSGSIIQACTAAGITVFPTVNDYWHFDDKVAQKYIFESLSIPTPKTHVFLDRVSALLWIDSSNMPLVFKLKAGAGSINVSIVRTKDEARARVERMFGRGYPSTDAAITDIVTKVRLHRAKKDWIDTFKRLPKTIRTWRHMRNNLEWERGYVYFQEFIPGNDHDTRITVIGDRAFGFQRMVRPGDFRASGSGSILYDHQKIDLACVRLAFEAARRMGTSCIALDFIHRIDNFEPLIVEMSFGFVAKAVYDCPGHWRHDLVWCPGHTWPQDVILEDILVKI